MAPRTIDFRYAPAVTWTAIGRPDDPYKTIVGRDGALLYDFELMFDKSEGWLFHRTYSFNLANGGPPVKHSQSTEEASNPITVTIIEYPKAVLTLRALGHQHDGDRRTDMVLWTIEPREGVRDYLTGLGITVQDSRNYFFLKDFAFSGHQVDYVAMTDIPSDSWRFGRKKQLKARAKVLPAFLAYPDSLAPYQGKASSTAPAFLHGYQECESGRKLQGAILIPQNHSRLDAFDWPWAEQALKAERTFWAGLKLQKNKLQVPDRSLMSMIQASARNMLQAREIKDGIVEFQVGACHYRSLWVIDGHFMLEAARYLGYREDADQGVAALLRRAKEDGSIAQLSFHSKETAISMATLVRDAELTDDWEGLRQRWPAIRRAFDHIQSMRDEACAYDSSHPAYRLMPESFADGGIGGGRAEFTTTLWTMIGLRKAAEAARHLNMQEDAESIQEAFEKLKADFLFRAQQQMLHLPDGLPYLPMWISGGDHMLGLEGPVPVEYRLKPASGTWAFCHAIYPGELFSAEDPLVQNFMALLDRIDDEEGIPAETGWMPHQGLWNYYASFAAHVWLYGGRPDKAIDYLYAFANHASPTRVWREEQSLKNNRFDLWWGDMPHNWAGAEFIRLVRHLLVLERSGGLDLLYGLPPEWLVSKNAVVAQDTPTRYGPVSLTLKGADQGSVSIEVRQTENWSTRAEDIRLHLPGQVDLSSIRCDEQPVAIEAGRFLPLRPGAKMTRVEFRLLSPDGLDG